MRIISTFILLFISCKNIFSQNGLVSADTFSLKLYNRSKDLVFRSDSTFYLHTRGRYFEFGAWERKGDTISTKTYRFIEADTTLFNNDKNKIIISVFSCDYIPLPYYQLKFHQPEILRKTNENGEIIINKESFSGRINQYNISSFLDLGLNSISIYDCEKENSLSKSTDDDFERNIFIVNEAGLMDKATNKLWTKHPVNKK